MKEQLLVLAKAAPIVSSKYEQLVCIGGITKRGEWRRVYPVPWNVFFKTSGQKFSKKNWIEYELRSTEPSDYRRESRKVRPETIVDIREERFTEIKRLLEPRVTTIENLQEQKATDVSLGVIKPKITDFFEGENTLYEELKAKQDQLALSGKAAIQIEVPTKRFSFKFKCSDSCNGHKILCEDWEVSELYRNCKRYQLEGKPGYRTDADVFQKVKERMMERATRPGTYFVVGTHSLHPKTYLIVGMLYPKKADYAPL